MSFLPSNRVLLVALGLAVSGLCHAESLASSASSAGSASSGSASDSLHKSSNSSSGNDRRAEGDYRVIEVGLTPDRAGFARLALQADDSTDTLTLDLPQAVAAAQRIQRGDLVHAQRQVYGLAFAHGDAREPFFLVLDDDWFDGIKARPVKL